MSYPKKHPIYGQSAVDSRTLEKLQRKEQLKSLLVQKYKSKYGVKGETNEQSKLIKSEIESLLNTNNMSLNALNDLDKKLKTTIGSPTNMIKGLQGQEPQLKGAESVKSLRSSIRTDRSKGLQEAGKQLLKNSSMQDLGMTYSTNQGAQSTMTKRLDLQDELWSEIVRYNYEQYQKDQERDKQRKEEQRRQMKLDLAKQVAEKRKEKLDELKAEEKYSNWQKDLLKEEQQREQKKHQDYLDKIKQEAQIRQEQLHANNERKKIELKNNRNYEEQLKRRMQQELLDEETKQKQKIEVFRQQCARQLEENKQLRDITKQRELEEENKGPTGKDLMTQLYEEKKHISYDKRERNDKMVELLQSKLAQGESQKRQNQEEQAILNYVKNKEREDRLDDERRLKNKRLRELEMKRILDIQTQERKDQKRLVRYEEKFEAENIRNDVEQYNQVENEKKKQYDLTVKEFQQRLVRQIEEKKQPKEEIPPELKMNQPLLDQIRGVKV